MLTSLRSLWLPGGKFLEALSVVQQLPRLRHVVVPVSALCGKCVARKQPDLVALALICRRGVGGLDAGGGCKHFPGDLQACVAALLKAEEAVDALLKAEEAAAKQAAPKAHAAPAAGASECDTDSDYGSEVWVEYDDA